MISFRNIQLFFGVFLLTLINHGIYTWALGLAILLVHMFICRVSINKQAAIEGFILFSLLIFSALRFQIYLIYEVLPLFINAFWGNFAGLVLCLLVWVSFRSLLASCERERVLVIIKQILFFNVCVFYLQFFTYLLSGYYIDFLQPFTGEKSRYLSFDSSLIGIGSFRPTGFFAEPSNYFMCVLALLSLLLVHEGFEKNIKLFMVTVLSMYLSFSTAAIAIATLFLVYYLYVRKINVKGFVAIMVVVMGLFFLNINTLSHLYLSQVNKADNSSGMRFALIELAAERDIDDAFFAFGPFAIDSNIYTATEVSEFERRQAGSLNDSSLIVYLWIVFGYAGLIFFSFLCLKEKRAGKHCLPLFLLLSLTKISFTHPLFIIYLAISLSRPTITSSLLKQHKK